MFSTTLLRSSEASMKRRDRTAPSLATQLSRLGRISQANDRSADCRVQREGRKPSYSVEKHQRGRIARPLWFRDITWLRGLDLNQRPLGYEPFSNQDWSLRATNNAT